ncbi:putative glycosyltransferase [Dendrobium catenatum]|uniref:Putative glycosyltransferase n=1 Tax=Dendrobium catenatum TaxID=906689 RepID=A0A2I0WQY1_9ASPA|nr:putative glycosyltransferase [Dendrobium catenatum]
MHGRVRPILLEHWGNGKDEDMKIFGPLPNQISKKISYIEHMKSSKFCICPMGFEVNSPRIVEAFYYECVPVIIADNFVLPFEEVLDWSAFSVVVAEKDIPNLKDILLRIPLRKYIRMQQCVKRLQRHFLWHPRPEKYDLFHMILHSIWFSRLNHMNPS